MLDFPKYKQHNITVYTTRSEQIEKPILTHRHTYLELLENATKYNNTTRSISTPRLYSLQTYTHKHTPARSTVYLHPKHCLYQ
jgi:hypothetical protein